MGQASDEVKRCAHQVTKPNTQDGFAEAIDELEIGLAAVAAPVRGPGGEVIAALSISGPTIRMTPERIAAMKPVLIEEARALSRRLGNPEQGENAA